MSRVRRQPLTQDRNARSTSATKPLLDRLAEAAVSGGSHRDWSDRDWSAT